MNPFKKKKLDANIVAAIAELKKERKLSKKELIEEINKRQASFPRVSGVDYYKGFMIELYDCPDCGASVGSELLTYAYCPRCGKKLRYVK